MARRYGPLWANDALAEHEIYGDDAGLEYPQSGEHIRGEQPAYIVSIMEFDDDRHCVLDAPG